MIKMGFITDIVSVYKITEEQLLSVDKVKEKLAHKVLESIEASKND